MKITFSDSPCHEDSFEPKIDGCEHVFRYIPNFPSSFFNPENFDFFTMIGLEIKFLTTLTDSKLRITVLRIDKNSVNLAISVTHFETYFSLAAKSTIYQ